ncbi:MAG: helix-turn-helix transcriptional regulator [Oscillospiraceae bacterium]|nr:helix-turn-helix transcriptional regulator [Oscillospiraceae bacterium]
MDIKDTLISIREKNGYSKKTVSEKTGIPYTTYVKYESGERKDVSMQAICKLADFYGVSADYLLGRPDAKPPENPVDSFVKNANLKELEEILIKEYLKLSDRQRESVIDFMQNVIKKEEERKLAEAEAAKADEEQTVTEENKIRLYLSNDDSTSGFIKPGNLPPRLKDHMSEEEMFATAIIQGEINSEKKQES